MKRPTEPDVVLLAAAADPIRLAILRTVANGPGVRVRHRRGYSVAQPTVSHHLRVLREAGWIAGERRGTWISYSIQSEAMVRFQAIGAAFGADSSLPGRRLSVVQPTT